MFTPTLTTATDPFATRFGPDHRLPTELRDEAANLSWGLFTATYAPAPTIRLTDLRSEPIAFNFTGRCYTASVITTSKVAEPIHRDETIVASGPVAACVGLLGREGRPIEILTYRQVDLFESTAAFIRARDTLTEGTAYWAMGFGVDQLSAIAAATSSVAQRIWG